MNNKTLISDEQFQKMHQKQAERNEAKEKLRREELGLKICCSDVSEVDGSAYIVYSNGEDFEYVISPDGLPEGETPRCCDCPKQNPMTIKKPEFNTGDLIEAVHPKSRCWLKAELIAKGEDPRGKYKVKWWDNSLSKSVPKGISYVDEIRVIKEAEHVQI